MMCVVNVRHWNNSISKYSGNEQAFDAKNLFAHFIHVVFIFFQFLKLCSTLIRNNFCVVIYPIINCTDSMK